MTQEEKQEFDHKWELIKGKVGGFFFRRGCPEEDVRDLVQETGIAAWENLDKLKGDFKSWVYGIARMLFKNYLRRKKREFDVEGDFDVVDPVSNPVHSAISKTLMKRCLDELEEIDRKCLMLHDYYGHNFEETGKILGISRSNVHYRVKRVRKYLRERFPELVENEKEGDV